MLLMNDLMKPLQMWCEIAYGSSRALSVRCRIRNHANQFEPITTANITSTSSPALSVSAGQVHLFCSRESLAIEIKFGDSQLNVVQFLMWTFCVCEIRLHSPLLCYRFDCWGTHLMYQNRLWSQFVHQVEWSTWIVELVWLILELRYPFRRIRILGLYCGWSIRATTLIDDTWRDLCPNIAWMVCGLSAKTVANVIT